MKSKIHLSFYLLVAIASFAKPVAGVEPKTVKQKEAKFHAPEMIAIPGTNYEMGKYEVTQAEWKAVGGNNPSKHKGATLPVENVSWDDIQIYLTRLNQKTGKKYRLPDEVEWEYACYGGSQTKYCGGNEAYKVAWIRGNSSNQTHPVGQKQANGYGLYDMSGNVWEWMGDCLEGDCSKHVLRGGSWYLQAWHMHAKVRDWNYSERADENLGFRLARTLP